MGLAILLYVPNIIGYIRLILLVISWCFYDSRPSLSICFYCVSAGLDAIDGIAARRLKQTSAFGAWFDVVIDNLGRGMIWCRTYHIGFLPASLEWLTFACTHQKGAAWKGVQQRDPLLVRAVMSNNFRNPWGVVAVGSLHVLPVWLFCHYHGLLTAWSIPSVIQHVGIGLLAAGRALCAAVETWYIWSHICYMCSDELNRPTTTETENE
eukprot:GHVO01060702.1.p1 GENE.GHVO01060702.1~~GHVO01060702.1.p1  ORF type:complete len:209 (+),score=6.22 GHVO01060702.1:56-682(+)